MSDDDFDWKDVQAPTDWLVPGVKAIVMMGNRPPERVVIVSTNANRTYATILDAEGRGAIVSTNWLSPVQEAVDDDFEMKDLEDEAKFRVGQRVVCNNQHDLAYGSVGVIKAIYGSTYGVCFDKFAGKPVMGYTEDELDAAPVQEGADDDFDMKDLEGKTEFDPYFWIRDGVEAIAESPSGAEIYHVVVKRANRREQRAYCQVVGAARSGSVAFKWLKPYYPHMKPGLNLTLGEAEEDDFDMKDLEGEGLASLEGDRRPRMLQQLNVDIWDENDDAYPYVFRHEEWQTPIIFYTARHKGQTGYNECARWIRHQYDRHGPHPLDPQLAEAQDDFDTKELLAGSEPRPEHTERWVFTSEELDHPQTCHGHDEFVAWIPGYELGVMVRRNGEVTNRWSDGTAGVPEEVVREARREDSLMRTEVTEDGLYADTWHDVIADDRGNFVNWLFKPEGTPGHIPGVGEGPDEDDLPMDDLEESADDEGISDFMKDEKMSDPEALRQWLSDNLEFDEDYRIWILDSFGDYSGSLVDRSNVEYWLKRYPNFVILRTGFHGFGTAGIPDAKVNEIDYGTFIDLQKDWARKEDYPVLDGRGYADLEAKWRRRAWESWIKQYFWNRLRTQFPDLDAATGDFADTALGDFIDSEAAYRLFEEARDLSGHEWSEDSGGQQVVPVADVADYVTREMLLQAMNHGHGLEEGEEPMDESLVQEAREFSCVLADAPPALADAVLAWGQGNITDDELYVNEDEPGDYGREDRPHVTCKFGLHEVKPSEALLRIIEQTQPFEIEVGTASLFEADEYDVLKFDVESNALRAFNERLSTLPNTDEHPIFRPHLAVAYIQHGTCRDLLGLPLVDSSEPAATRFLVKSVLFSGKNGDKITLFLGKPNEL